MVKNKNNGEILDVVLVGFVAAVGGQARALQASAVVHLPACYCNTPVLPGGEKGVSKNTDVGSRWTFECIETGM